MANLWPSSSSTTPREDSFDETAQLAADLCGTPIAAVSVIDGDRQRFKARVGITVESNTRQDGFCSTLDRITMTAPPPAGPPPTLVQRFDEAQRALGALLSEALSTSAPGAFVEAIGLEAIERHLPSDARLRLLQHALQAGRAGRPFDDVALLAAVPPAVLVAHLPPAVLREALGRLAPASLEAAPGPVAIAPAAPVAAVGAVVTAPMPPGAVAMVVEPGPGDEPELESLDEDDELTVALDDEGTQALLAQLPPGDESPS